MSDLDSVIAELHASIRALEEAEDHGKSAQLEEEHLVTIRESRAALDAMLKKMYVEALKLKENIKVRKPLEFKSKPKRD